MMHQTLICIRGCFWLSALKSRQKCGSLRDFHQLYTEITVLIQASQSCILLYYTWWFYITYILFTKEGIYLCIYMQLQLITLQNNRQYIGNLWLNSICTLDIKRKYSFKIFIEHMIWYLGFWNNAVEKIEWW